EVGHARSEADSGAGGGYCRYVLDFFWLLLLDLLRESNRVVCADAQEVRSRGSDQQNRLLLHFRSDPGTTGSRRYVRRARQPDPAGGLGLGWSGVVRSAGEVRRPR